MKRWLAGLLVVVVVAGALVAWLFVRSPKERPPQSVATRVSAATLRDPALIARGQYLATVGDCAACHTRKGGVRYAGGRSLATPFGNVPAPNITPDPDTGLGRWSFEDFWRALHLGKGRHGELLYPVFSYTSFTKVTPDDALAIFAYLQSLAPVRQTSEQPSLRFPYSVRRSLAAWRALYFKPGVYQADPAQSAQWNRGAYLVQGLGHCNECHATRDALGGLSPDHTLTGGQIPEQNWYAPDLSARPGGGLEGWSTRDIVDLLKTGQSAKGAAFGPMADVVRKSTQHMTDTDLEAIATYLQSLPARPAAEAAVSHVSFDRKKGAKLYADRCADCHGADGRGVAGIYPPLDGNTSVNEPTGINAIRTVLLGGFAPVTAGNPRPYSMPPYAQELNDEEVATVVSYIRQSWSNKASAVRPSEVSTYRHTPID
jgi:mono/diheme cytochrome c family protein